MSATISPTPSRDTPEGAINHAEEVRRLNRRDGWLRRLPLLPALLFTIVVTQVPFVLSLWYSLTDWTITPPTDQEFIGVGNYTDLASDRFFLEAAQTSIFMTVAAVLLSVVLGTAIAMLLDRKFFGQGFVRTLLITPFLIMPVVAGLVWKTQMFSSLYGVLNWVLETLGFESIEFVSRAPTWSVSYTHLTLPTIYSV